MPAKEVFHDLSGLPEPGHPGNLTEEQAKTLQKFWKEWFGWVQNATGSDTGGKTSETASGKSKDSGEPKKGDSKDDGAQEEELAKNEAKHVQALLTTFSGKAIQRGLWDMAKFEPADSVFCRFLRARKWNLPRALGMFAGALKWRLESPLETLVRAGDEGNDHIENFIDQQRSGKYFGFGATEKEQLMIYITVRKHLTKGQPPTSMEKFIIYAMESLRLLIPPPAQAVSLVFDLEGFGTKNMDWHTVLYVVSVLSNYYPECLGTLYVVHAPWIFNGIWKALAPMLDPVVRSKVRFIKRISDAVSELPEDRVPKSFEGKADYEYEYPEAKPGANKLLENTEEYEKRLNARDEQWLEFEKVTQEWVSSGDQKLADQRRVLAKKIRVAHFDLEPYYRGNFMYDHDRMDVLNRNGRVTWFYQSVDGGEKVRHVMGRADSSPVLRREIHDVEEENLSVDDAEKRTREALKSQDWVALYGSQETAVEVEGAEYVSGADSKQADAQQSSTKQAGAQQSDNGRAEFSQSGGSGDDAAAGAAAAGAGAGAGVGAAGAGGAAAASSSSQKQGSNEASGESQALHRVTSGTNEQSNEVFHDAQSNLEDSPAPLQGEGTTSFAVEGSNDQQATNGQSQAQGGAVGASTTSSTTPETAHKTRSSSSSNKDTKSDMTGSETSFNPFRKDQPPKHPKLHKLTHKVAEKLKLEKTDKSGQSS